MGSGRSLEAEDSLVLVSGIVNLLEFTAVVSVVVDGWIPGAN